MRPRVAIQTGLDTFALCHDRAYAVAHGFTLVAQILRAGQAGKRIAGQEAQHVWAFAAPISNVNQKPVDWRFDAGSPGSDLLILCPDTHEIFADRIRRCLIAPRWPSYHTAAQHAAASNDAGAA
jgi:hypothetical protein